MFSNKKIIEKVRKILAKANNNPSMEEAETVMLIAQRIMVENNLCIDDVNLTEVNEIRKEAIEVKLSDKMRLSWWEKNLSGIIAKNFRCLREAIWRYLLKEAYSAYFRKGKTHAGGNRSGRTRKNTYISHFLF